MPSLDFSLAKMKHESWKTKLRGFLDGRLKIDDSELSSEKECALGKWLYSEGLSKYGTISDLKQLEREHAQMHETVKKVVHLKRTGDAAGAQQGYERVCTMSSKIVALLATLEKQVS